MQSMISAANADHKREGQDVFEIQFIHCQERKRPEGLDDIGGLIAEGVRKKDFSHIDIEAAANIQIHGASMANFVRRKEPPY